MRNSYWDQITQQRVTRRRAMAATAGSAAGAMLLAACGGKSSDEPEDKSGLLTNPPDTSAKAVPGGVWQTTSGNLHARVRLLLAGIQPSTAVRPEQG
jgi:hypothetical protein